MGEERGDNSQAESEEAKRSLKPREGGEQGRLQQKETQENEREEKG